MLTNRRSLIIIVLGISLSLLISGLTLQYEIGVVEKKFSDMTRTITEKIKNRLQQVTIIDGKLSLLFQFSEHVSDENFSLVSQTILPQAPYIEKIIYAPQIRNTHKTAEEKKMQYAGYSGFQFRPFPKPNMEKSPFSDVIFPVKFIQPYTPYTSVWFGRDIMTYSPVKDLLKKLILNYQKLQLAVIKNSDNKELYLFSAVGFIDHARKTSHTTDEVFGILGYKVNLDKWLTSLVDKNALHALAVLDEYPLFQINSFDENTILDLRQMNSIDFAGQLLKLHYQLHDPASLIDYRIPLLMLVSGLLFSGLIYFIEKNVTEKHRLLSKQNYFIEKKVAEKTALLKKQSLELNSAYTQQLAITKELESFSYSISHDLRAPLRSISGFAHALNEDHSDQFNEEAKDMLMRVQNSAQRMNLLINDLLFLAKVSRREFISETFSISKLVNEKIQEILDRHPSYRFDADVTQNLEAKGDRRLVSIALDNLLTNALKYSSKSESPRIAFGTTLKSSIEVFYVRDNGVGFNMQYAHKLFTPFQRLHGAEFEGTGIGLATVQRVINRHNGKIWAESEPGKETTFYFTLSQSGNTNAFPD